VAARRLPIGNRNKRDRPAGPFPSRPVAGRAPEGLVAEAAKRSVLVVSWKGTFVKRPRLVGLVVVLTALTLAPMVSKASSEPVFVPIKAPVPAWYTPELHAKIVAAGDQGVPLPPEAAIPMSSLAFLGIRPGQLIILTHGPVTTFCSSNFVFRNGANFSIGTAGHCGVPGDQVSMLFAPRGLVTIGSVTKSVSAEGPAGVGNDFALISIKPSLKGLVSPSMPFWGGPTGPWSKPTVPNLVKHVGWGAGVGTGGTPRVGVGLVYHPTSFWSFAGLIAPIDSGSGAIAASGQAVGNITHIAAFHNGEFTVMVGTSITRILQIAGLPLATCPPIPWPLYGCPHL